MDTRNALGKRRNQWQRAKRKLAPNLHRLPRWPLLANTDDLCHELERASAQSQQDVTTRARHRSLIGEMNTLLLLLLPLLLEGKRTRDARLNHSTKLDSAQLN